MVNRDIPPTSIATISPAAESKPRTAPFTATALALVICLNGCATQQNQQQVEGANGGDPCNEVSGAAMGAVAGSIIGALLGGRDGARTGALVGGIGGALACVAMKVNSRQTKTAEQSEQDYRRARGNLPSSPAVVAYQSDLESGVTAKGQPFRVRSSVEVVNGRSEPVRTLSEEIVIFGQDGQKLGGSTKQFTTSSAGRFENNFEVNLGASAPQGIYPLQTQVSLNGRVVATRDLRIQIVWNGSHGVLVASR